MNGKYKNYLLLHLIVFIYGFTGILGALITIPAPTLVWYRMLIGTGGILVFLLISRKAFIQPLPLVLRFAGTGGIIALHWIFFFQAIKVSNVSVTLATLSSATLFTSILEPLIFRRKVLPYEVVFGVIIIAGLMMIFNFERRYSEGILLTLFSSLMASLFTVINGGFAKRYEASVVSLYEMAGGFLCICIYFLLRGSISLTGFSLSVPDLIWLLVLGLVCTAFALIVSISIMKEITPFTVTMTINLEPVYGIILAWLIFGQKEQMTTGFYIGSVLILVTIFLNAWLKRKRTGELGLEKA